MPVERVLAGGSAGIPSPGGDVPRTLVSIASLIALAVFGLTTLHRIVSGGPALPGLAYASMTGVETLWFAGHAILIASQD